MKYSPEKRSHERFSASLEVRYKILDWNEPFLSKTKNVSEGGICVLMDAALKPGTPLELEFQDSAGKSKKTILVAGTVVWSKEVTPPDDRPSTFSDNLSLSPWNTPIAVPQGEVPAFFTRCFETGIKLSKANSHLITRLLNFLTP